MNTDSVRRANISPFQQLTEADKQRMESHREAALLKIREHQHTDRKFFSFSVSVVNSRMDGMFFLAAQQFWEMHFATSFFLAKQLYHEFQI